MLTRKDFIKKSLEYNLFFARIMKEHMIFIESGLLTIDSTLVLEGEELKESFEDILKEAINLANGAVDKAVLNSNELVTNYTLESEIITEKLTGICINKDLTKAELDLLSNSSFTFTQGLESELEKLNERAINLVKEVISYKEKILKKLLDCKLFANLYPLLIDHIMREAIYYLKALESLQRREEPVKDILDNQIFWDTIMMEHAQFVRGLLDPTEVELFNTANDLAEAFEDLIEITKKAGPKDIPKVTKMALEDTIEIRDFKQAGTEGLIDCQIQVIAYPLLADHILREANRYIRVLKSI
ncbi:MAG: DUF2935 domain-containing protein [Tissierellia bacterium]|nr:DUF2935 domain-containing protein [Tissierellia bacterium]